MLFQDEIDIGRVNDQLHINNISDDGHIIDDSHA